MRLKYLTTLAAISLMSMGLAVGCAQTDTTPADSPSAAPPAAPPATAPDAAKETKPCASKGAPCASKDAKPAETPK